MTIYSPDKSIKAIICKNDTDITLKEYYILDPNRNYTRSSKKSRIRNLIFRSYFNSWSNHNIGPIYDEGSIYAVESIKTFPFILFPDART